MSDEAIRYGCHVDLFDLPEEAQPDDCVIDAGRRDLCVYASRHGRKELCPYWRRITPESIRQAREGEA